MFICRMGMVSFISWPLLLRRTSADAVRADARAFLHRRPQTMYRAAGGGRGLKSRSFQLLWRNPSHIPPFPDPVPRTDPCPRCQGRSEEHTSELQSLMRISYAVFCLKKKKQITKTY